MEFRRIEPTGLAARAVDCYWIVKDDNSTRVKQKIIPDGYAEIIFHFGSPYRINLDGNWKEQGRRLLAGQITKHFFLENTGVVDIMGIKLKPTAPAHLFGIAMKDVVDKVIGLDKKIKIDVDNVDQCFNELCKDYPADHPADKAVEFIFSKKGMVTVASICKEVSVSERYLQQLFRKYVGVSPKFFARVVRFSYIFQLIKDKDPDWAQVVYEAGYYDQSHFIRNFKAFTGEDPSEYIFAEKNLANFFMKKNE
ncbi:MAG: helix-turn-helix domain-containing protein [Bacteroidota bacterium]